MILMILGGDIYENPQIKKSKSNWFMLDMFVVLDKKGCLDIASILFLCLTLS
jgi:hypothetical protein